MRSVHWLSALALLASTQLALAATQLQYNFAGEALGSNPATAVNSGTLGAAVNGTVTGATIVASPFSGDGVGADFSGSGSGVNLPNAFDFDTVFSIEALFKLDSLGAEPSALFDDYGNPGVLLIVNPEDGKLAFSLSTAANPGPGATIKTLAAVTLGEWHHVVAVYDGAEARLFLDCDLQGTLATSGAVQNHPDVTPNIAVESNDTSFPWDGVIDDLRLFDTVLEHDDFNDGREVPNCDDDTPVIPLPAGVWMGLSAFGVHGIGMWLRSRARRTTKE